MAQETPIEWLVEHLYSRYEIDIERLMVTDQAKAIEREKLELAFYEGMQSFPFDANKGRAKLYYESTYKKD